MSFTRAAEELNVTSTAVSHQIRRLEAFLQTRLFHRQHRSLRLTSEGQEYLPVVRGAFEDLREATGRLFETRRTETLTLSTLTYVGARWIVQRLGGFKALRPHIDVRIVTSPHPVDFTTSGVDMGIRRGDGHWPGLRADQLMIQQCVPVLSPRLLPSGGRGLSAADLQQFTLLHVATEPAAWRQWFRFAGIPAADVSHGLTFDQSITAIQAAIDGLGIAIGRMPFIDNELDAGLLAAPVPLYLPDQSPFYIVAPEATADHPNIRQFREWLLAEVQSLWPKE